MFVLAGGAVLRESVTIDEVAHIGAGLSYLQKLDLRFNEEHPPLAKVLAALPLVARGTRADYSGTIWNVSQDFFPAYLGQWVFGEYVLPRWNQPESTLAWARLPMLLLTIALGWVVFACARRLGGDWGGLLCLVVYVSTPVFLVFGPLVLTDIPVTLFSLCLSGRWPVYGKRRIGRIRCCSLSRWPRSSRSSPRRSCSSSSSGGVEYAVAAPRRGASKLPWRAIRKATLWAGLMVYAVYFLLSWNQPVDIPKLAGHGPLVALLGRLLMPPWLLLRGVAWVVLTGNRPTFLLGHAYQHGVWFYFPVLVILKSSPGFLGLLAVALVAAVAGQRGVIPRESAALWRVLWVALVVLAFICMVSHFDVSIRHFTTPLVLMILLLAPLPRLLRQIWTAAPRLAWSACAIVVLLSVGCLATAVRAYPNYFPYINPLFAGHPGYWLVNDSNFDWNHALPQVEQFARRHDLKDIPLDTYGYSDDTAFVPQSRLWDCQAPSAADAGLGPWFPPT